MKPTRVRCECGAVFNPQDQSVCPACGAAADNEQAETSTLPSPPAEASAAPARPAPTDAHASPKKNPVGLIAGAAAAVVIIVIIMFVMGTGNNDDGGNSEVIADASQSPSGGSHSNRTERDSGKTTAKSSGVTTEGSFEGQWELLSARMQPESVVPGIPTVSIVMSHAVVAAFTGPGSKATLEIDADGLYTFSADVMGEGQYAATMTPQKAFRSPEPTRAKGTVTFTPKNSTFTDRTSASISRVEADIPHIKAKKDDTRLLLMPAGVDHGAQAFFYRAGGSGQPHTSVVGTWTNHMVFIDSYIPYMATLEIKDNGDYRVRFTRSENGLFDAKDGQYEFKRSIAAGPPVTGKYTFNGPDQFTLTEPRGTTTWVRAKQ